MNVTYGIDVQRVSAYMRLSTGTSSYINIQPFTEDPSRLVDLHA